MSRRSWKDSSLNRFKDRKTLSLCKLHINEGWVNNPGDPSTKITEEMKQVRNVCISYFFHFSKFLEYQSKSLFCEKCSSNRLRRFVLFSQKEERAITTDDFFYFSRGQWIRGKKLKRHEWWARLWWNDMVRDAGGNKIGYLRETKQRSESVNEWHGHWALGKGREVMELNKSEGQ